MDGLKTSSLSVSGLVCGVQGKEKIPYVLERNVEIVRELEEVRGQEAELKSEENSST